MAVVIKTNNPMALLQALHGEVKKKHIYNWSCDRQSYYGLRGGYSTTFFPSTGPRVLIMNMVGYEDDEVTLYDYARQHAELVRVLLENFDDLFDCVCATAEPLDSDWV